VQFDGKKIKFGCLTCQSIFKKNKCSCEKLKIKYTPIIKKKHKTENANAK